MVKENKEKERKCIKCGRLLTPNQYEKCSFCLEEEELRDI